MPDITEPGPRLLFGIAKMDLQVRRSANNEAWFPPGAGHSDVKLIFQSAALAGLVHFFLVICLLANT